MLYPLWWEPIQTTTGRWHHLIPTFMLMILPHQKILLTIWKSWTKMTLCIMNIFSGKEQVLLSTLSFGVDCVPWSMVPQQQTIIHGTTMWTCGGEKIYVEKCHGEILGMDNVDSMSVTELHNVFCVVAYFIPSSFHSSSPEIKFYNVNQLNWYWNIVNYTTWWNFV